MTFPFSRCTCARESASAASQRQQAVFHRGVTEAREIRAESAQNNRAKTWDNPQPNIRGKWWDARLVHHPPRIRPQGKQGWGATIVQAGRDELPARGYWSTSAAILHVSWDYNEFLSCDGAPLFTVPPPRRPATQLRLTLQSLQRL